MSIINHSDKLEGLKHALRNVGENSLLDLHMIDVMQCQNNDYQFQEEIEAFLCRQYSISLIGCYGHDLDNVVLHFGLLKQQGYFLPIEMFHVGCSIWKTYVNNS